MTGQENILIQKIATWCHKTHTAETLIGVGDDAAAVFPSGRPILICSDMMLEGQHWTGDLLSHADVGYKALARSLSDIAAMGGKPLGATISLAISQSLRSTNRDRFLEEFYRGATAASLQFKAPIIGGDLSTINGPTAIDVSLVGELFSECGPWRRSGVRPGDLAFLSGPLGAAALAYRFPDAAPETALLKLRRPTPRLDLAEGLHVHCINAAIDISDGLLLDAARLCRASRIGLVLAADRVPIAPALFDNLNRKDALALALTGGDDYELLLAIPSHWARCDFAREVIATHGLIEVGEFVPESTEPNEPAKPTTTSPVCVVDTDGRALQFTSAGHDPFKKDET